MGASLQIQGEAKDLANAGYYVVSINYELAPCGYVPNQPCHALDVHTPGWWIQKETDDVKAFVSALKADSHINPNKIGLVAGSAGATLGAFIALDTTNTNGQWPFWNAQARPVCAALLSGAYDFSDRTPPDGQVADQPKTTQDIENFAQTGDPQTQKNLSPISLVKTPTAQEPFVPLFMISSQYDFVVPHHQLTDMICALQSNNVPATSYQTLVIPNSDMHSFHYWSSYDGQPCTLGNCKEIRGDVIAYLDSFLK